MRATTAVLLALLLTACAGHPTAPAPRVTLEKCGIARLDEPMLCGELRVPENRARPQGAQIALNIVVVPARGERTLPPLYDLAGGPGLPATGAATFWATDGAIHRQHRDIVLVDQRGTGGSAPLPCPVFLSSPFAPVLELSVIRLCRERLAPVADLSQYSTAAAVADLEAVRAAFGHERIDLTGLSYGTRLAQEYVRQHPDRVRAMALLGTLSPMEKMPLSSSRNAQAVLVRIGQQCAEDRACRKAVPSMARDLEIVQRTFARGPIKVALANGATATVAEGPFWEAVRAQLATVSGQRRLPWLLHQAARGHYAPILAAMAPSSDRFATGMMLSVACPEDTLHITHAEVEASRNTVFGVYRVHEQIAACHAWAVPAIATRPDFLNSDVPTLLMAGDMDPSTPVAWAQDVVAHLPNARLVVVPGLAHFPEGMSHLDCFDRIIADFFTAGRADALDLDCLASMKPAPFKTKVGGD